MSEKPQFQELANRIKAHLASSDDNAAKREISIAWDGYIAALLEWDMISIQDHQELYSLLPKVEKSPVGEILTGVDGQYS